MHKFIHTHACPEILLGLKMFYNVASDKAVKCHYRAIKSDKYRNPAEISSSR